MTASRFLRQPLTWLPLAMSCAALALVLAYLARFGITEAPPGADEGATARLFQLLLVAQLPVVAAQLALRVPRDAMRAAEVATLQVAAAALPVVLIVWLEA